MKRKEIEIMTLEEALAAEYGGSNPPIGMQVKYIPASKIIPCPLHKFTLNNQRVAELEQSIAENGLMTPLMVRDSEDQPGYYEQLAGYHRYAACKNLGMDSLPCFVRNVDDDKAMDIIIYTNMQTGLDERKKTEVGASFKERHDLQKRQGKRNDLTESEPEESSLSQLMQEQGWGKTKIRRYIRFAYLSKTMGALLNDGFLSDYAAEQLSFLTKPHQEECAVTMKAQKKPLTLEQAKTLKETEFSGDFTQLLDNFFEKTDKKMKPPQVTVKLPIEEIADFLPNEVKQSNKKDVKAYIMQVLEAYSIRQKQENNFHLT